MPDRSDNRIDKESKKFLLSRIKMIESEQTKIDGHREQIKDIKVEVKVAGYDMKAFNAVLSARRAKAKDEAKFEESEAMRDLYLVALGVID